MTDKSLFEPHRLAEIQSRIANLTPNSTREWGKMQPAQMMAHCTKALEGASLGGWTKPRIVIGYILGGFARRAMLERGEPMRKNSPTPKEAVVDDARDFDTERARLAHTLEEFAAAGEAGVTYAPHFFFGKLTPNEWAVLQYQHLDHHLRQFGV